MVIFALEPTNLARLTSPGAAAQFYLPPAPESARLRLGFTLGLSWAEPVNRGRAKKH